MLAFMVYMCVLIYIYVYVYVCVCCGLREAVRQIVKGLNIMMNVGNAETAISLGQLPKAGIGFARLEFVIGCVAGLVAESVWGCPCPTEFYVNKIAEGTASLAAFVYSKCIISRLPGFKYNKYNGLIGSEQYELF